MSTGTCWLDPVRLKLADAGVPMKLAASTSSIDSFNFSSRAAQTTRDAAAAEPPVGLSYRPGSSSALGPAPPPRPVPTSPAAVRSRSTVVQLSQPLAGASRPPPNSAKCLLTAGSRSGLA